MTGDELLNAMEHIDAKLIDAADRPARQVNTLPYWAAALAAMLVLLLGIGIFLRMNPGGPAQLGTQASHGSSRFPPSSANPSGMSHSTQTSSISPIVPAMVGFESLDAIKQFVLAANGTADQYNQYLEDHPTGQFITHDVAKAFATYVTNSLLPHVTSDVSIERFGGTYYADRKQLDLVFGIDGIRCRFVYDFDISAPNTEGSIYEGSPAFSADVNCLGTVDFYQAEKCFAGFTMQEKTMIRIFVYTQQQDAIDLNAFQFERIMEG